MDETPTPRPATDHPVWGPPRNLLAGERPAPRRVPTPTPQPNRRRHPAARARRIAGWAAVASSAALVGYMVTANAQGNSNNNSIATPTVQPTSPSVASIPSTVPTAREGDDDTPATVPATTATTTPATSTPVQLPIPTRSQQNRQPPQFGGGQPNSSTHGS